MCPGKTEDEKTDGTEDLTSSSESKTKTSPSTSQTYDESAKTLDDSVTSHNDDSLSQEFETPRTDKTSNAESGELESRFTDDSMENMPLPELVPDPYELFKA